MVDWRLESVASDELLIKKNGRETTSKRQELEEKFELESHQRFDPYKFIWEIMNTKEDCVETILLHSNNRQAQYWFWHQFGRLKRQLEYL